MTCGDVGWLVGQPRHHLNRLCAAVSYFKQFCNKAAGGRGTDAPRPVTGSARDDGISVEQHRGWLFRNPGPPRTRSRPKQAHEEMKTSARKRRLKQHTTHSGKLSRPSLLCASACAALLFWRAHCKHKQQLLRCCASKCCGVEGHRRGSERSHSLSVLDFL